MNGRSQPPGGGGHGGGHGGEPDGGPGGEREAAATWTALTAGATTYDGGSGQDRLYLGGSGATVTISSVEKLLGGAGTDVVTLTDSGSTLCVGGVETLTGGSGTDVVVIASFGATMTVSGVETLVGSGGADVVTVASGAVRYEVRGDNGAVTLAVNAAADKIVLSDGDGGRRDGFADTAAHNLIAGFKSGEDQVVLAGGLRGRLDDDRDGIVDSATAATGGIDVSKTEVAIVSAVAADLTDTDYASVRAAIGSLTNSGTGADVLAVVNDGTDAGLYVVTDRNGDGIVGATEIKLLGMFAGAAAVGAGDLIYG